MPSRTATKTAPAKTAPAKTTPAKPEAAKTDESKPAAKVTSLSLFRNLSLIDAEPVKGSGGPGRTAEPNPWIETVVGLIKADAVKERTTKGFTVPYGTTDEKDAAAKLIRQLQAAGTTPEAKAAGHELDMPNGVTIRLSPAVNKFNDVAKENDGNLPVKFWMIDKVLKPRKAAATPTDDTPADEAAEAVSK